MAASEQDPVSSFWSSADKGGREPRPYLGPRQRRARRKAFIQQAVVLVCVAALAVVLVRNTVVNLQARGLASGFDFLWQEAGFKIAFSLVPVEATSTYGRVFLAGLLNSLLVAAIGIVAATVVGFVVGLARVSPSAPVRLAAKGYVEIVRNLPLLLHLLLWQTVILRSLPTVREAIGLGGVAFLSNRGLYLPAPIAGASATIVSVSLLAGFAMVVAGWLIRRRALRRGETTFPAAWVLAAFGMLTGCAAAATLDWQVPQLAGFDYRGGLKLMPELVSLVAALAIYNAAFIAEIVRAGIQSVGHGQREAAAALGLPPSLILRLVIVPQALRVMVPPIANQYTHLIKASSLATVVGFPDLVNVFLGTSLNQTGRAVEIVVMTACVYLTLSAAVALTTGAYGRWIASDRAGCNPQGACWAFIVNRLPQFAFGFYPDSERWRAWIVLLAPPALLLLAVAPDFNGRRKIVIGGFCLYPFAALALLAGGPLGLQPVPSDKWGGLLLTMLVGMGAFVLSFPFAIVLALARASRLPAIRLIATGFIEFWRGMPLVAILFMSVIMLPLFLPPGVEVSRLGLAMTGITLYSGAYLAEVVRGGLQAVGRGQAEAADALGFGFWTTQGYIVMPQALKAVLPGIVNSAIALFKDTTYVMVVGLFDLLNIVTAALSDARWLGLATEGYVFVGLIYWSFCFGLSQVSARLERDLAGAHSREPSETRRS